MVAPSHSLRHFLTRRKSQVIQCPRPACTRDCTHAGPPHAYPSRFRLPDQDLKALDPDLSCTPIRVTQGWVWICKAKRLAAQLAGAAHLAFGHLQRNAAEGSEPGMRQHNDVGRVVRYHLTALLPVLRGLDGVGQNADRSLVVSSPAMSLQMADVGLTRLLDLAADRIISRTSDLMSADAPALERR